MPVLKFPVLSSQGLQFNYFEQELKWPDPPGSPVVKMRASNAGGLRFCPWLRKFPVLFNMAQKIKKMLKWYILFGDFSQDGIEL